MRNQMTASSVVVVGMFTAVLAVLSILEIPMPSGVPVTLQTFAVSLCGYVLGARRGIYVCGLYLLIGAVGVPVYSGMHAGIGWLLGPTGGFIFGFLILAGMCGMGTQMRRKYNGVLLGVAGLAVCHFFGVLQFGVVTDTGFLKSFLLVSLPYVIKDLVSVGAAFAAGSALRRRLILAHLMEGIRVSK